MSWMRLLRTGFVVEGDAGQDGGGGEGIDVAADSAAGAAAAAPGGGSQDATGVVDVAIAAPAEVKLHSVCWEAKCTVIPMKIQ